MPNYAQRALLWQASCYFILGGTAWLMHRAVPEPYMDEIFHIPQAKLFCERIYDQRDPSITTPPGLYFLSSFLIRFFHIPCTTNRLRNLNVILCMFPLPYLIRRIHGHLRTIPILRTEGPISEAYTKEHLLTEITRRTIVFFPLVTFFAGLYYTDLSSLIVVLGVYTMTLRRKFGWAGFIGLLSISFRQTNIIWVAFCMASAIMGQIRLDQLNESEEKKSEWLTVTKIEGIDGLIKALIATPKWILKHPKSTINVVKWYMPAFVAFALFLYVNGGIVLGHQEHHMAGLHFPQLFYFISFITLMGWPVLLNEGVDVAVKGTLAMGMRGWRRKTASIVALVLINLAVKHFTLVHPFTLSDNRHYFFYIWRRVFDRHWAVRYALTPGYLVCFWAWGWKLGRGHTLYWFISLGTAISLTLVPTPLVEPRYFLVPYILIRLHSLPDPGSSSLILNEPRAPKPMLLETRTEIKEGQTNEQVMQEAKLQFKHAMEVLKVERAKRVDGRMNWLYVELGWYTLINVLTIGLFLGYKFKWESLPDEWMRFMW